MIQIKQKNTWQGSLDVIDANGDPLDLTTATVAFYLWRVGAPAAALELTEADDQIVLGVDGTLLINLEAADTELNLGQYDMETRVSITLATVPYAVSQNKQVEVVDSLAYQGPGQ